MSNVTMQDLEGFNPTFIVASGHGRKNKRITGVVNVMTGRIQYDITSGKDIPIVAMSIESAIDIYNKI